ncbi:MAG: ubiquitin-like small modifier protein 2 [Haloferacaceae archaeon]
MDRTVTVRVVGGDTQEVAVGDDATYTDLLRAVGRTSHDATALVGGRPVPADAPVEAGTEEVEVLKLVVGG